MTSQARMPFGKYRGDLIADVPTSYLTWLLAKNEETPGYLDVLIGRAVALEVFARLILPIVEVDLTQVVNPRTRRPASDPHGVFEQPTAKRVGFKDDLRPTPPPSARDVDPELARQVVDAGYRVVSLRVHPDVGGDADAFTRLTRTVEALRTILPTIRPAR